MQKLQISIPEPCHENWHNMKPTEQGRFCNACAKEVVDFSMMTDTELLNYFTNITHEKVCGRALPSQLERTINLPKEPKKRLFWYWNYIVMFFMFFSKANTVKAQGGVKRVTEISNTPACKVGETVKSSSRVISGKVTDIDGNPVSFATIKIKGSPKGLSADANGGYLTRVKFDDILVFSGVGFKETEVHVGIQTSLNTFLEKAPQQSLGEVVVGYAIYRNSDENIAGNDKPKYNALLEVKDDQSALSIPKARIIITRGFTNYTAFTDKKGIYKLKGIKDYDEYYIKVEAEGYGPNEFTISGKDFKDKKKEWEVLLKKIETIKPDERPIRLGGISTVSVAKGPIYVVDGTIVPDSDNINTDDIENVTLLQPSAAAAIYGPIGAGGAMMITTKKLKTKNLDTVVVSTTICNKRSLVTGGMVKGVPIKRNKIADSIKTVKVLFAGPSNSLKVYPNPVHRGNMFNISLKLKQAGNYNIQIADAAGRIVLLKQTNILSKEHIEQLQTDNRWGSGVYYIRVFDNNNKPISKASFIVQ